MRLADINFPNFGDVLNHFIFNHLAPNFFDDSDHEVFLGIGSILGFEQFKTARKKIVFGTGYCAGLGSPPTIDHSYDIFCLRGPLTATALGVSKRLAITDAAALLRFIPLKAIEKKYRCSFMPHKSSEKLFDWPSLCEQVGIHHIPPSDNVEQVIDEIRSSEILLAEAMHGAITADVLRVPWIPVITSNRILEFKWVDWTRSIQCDFEPQRMKYIYQQSHLERSLQRRIGRLVPEPLIQLSARVLESGQRIRVNSVMNRCNQLQQAPTFLSEDDVFELKTSELMERFEAFKRKYVY